MAIFAKYLDSDKVREAVKYAAMAGKSGTAIAKELGISSQLVSYHLRRVGLSRRKLPNRKTMEKCAVCRSNPVVNGHVCHSPSCLEILFDTLSCEAGICMDKETKIVLHLQPKTTIDLPLDGSICTRQGVTKLFRTLREHIYHHAGRTYPGPIWRDEDEQRVHRAEVERQKWKNRQA